MTATDVTGFDAIFSTGFFATFPREASDLIFKIRSCAVRSDLKNKVFFFSDFVLIFKIRSYSARSDLKNKIARFSGSPDFRGARLTKLHREPGEKAKNPVESLQWRRRPEIADFCPLSWSNAS